MVFLGGIKHLGQLDFRIDLFDFAFFQQGVTAFFCRLAFGFGLEIYARAILRARVAELPVFDSRIDGVPEIIQ